MKGLKQYAMFFVAISIFALIAACGGSVQNDVKEAGEVKPTPEETVHELTLCPPDKLEKVDFGVLNTDSRPALEQGYMYKTLSKLSDGSVDEARIARDVATAFLNALNVPLSSVPEWFVELREKAISEAVLEERTVDYDFLNKVFARFLEDSKYSQYQDPEQKLKLFVAVNEGLIKAVGDPFASYITPLDVKLGAADTSGTIFGIGASVTRNQNNEWELTSIREGSPAEKSGLKNHDILRKVDGKSVAGCVAEKIVLKIRGAKGSLVHIVVARNKEELDFSVTRGLIKFEPIESWPAFEWPDGRGSTNKTPAYKFPLRDRYDKEVPGIAYIEVHSFDTQAGIDFYYILSQMPWERTSGLIVDLRYNPGGLVSVVEAMTGYFLPPRADIFRSESADGRKRISRNVSQRTCLSDVDVCLEPNLVPRDLPVAVIINKNSFSAAELMAGALQDHKRVTLVGERSGGKGTVNSHFTLRNGEYGMLYLAIQIWKTPNGRLIEPLHETKEGGLVPDVVIPQPLKGFAPDNDENIFKAIEILTGR